MFRDRIDAGVKLAEKLEKYKGLDLVVLSIPRGGVVIGKIIAERLNAPLDVVISRKLGAPGNPELAIGAIMENGEVILNEDIISMLNVSKRYLEEEKERQLIEVKRRARLYRSVKKPLNLKGKTVILVDDGLATGATMRMAIKYARMREAKRVIVAVPVAPKEAVELISREADEVICLETPEPFFAIGQFYYDFSQVSDSEVIELLKS